MVFSRGQFFFLDASVFTALALKFKDVSAVAAVYVSSIINSLKQLCEVISSHTTNQINGILLHKTSNLLQYFNISYQRNQN